MSLVPHTNPGSSDQQLTITGPLDVQAAISQALEAQNQKLEAKLESQDLLIEQLLSQLKDANISKSTAPTPSTSSQPNTATQKKSAPRKSVNIARTTPSRSTTSRSFTRAASEPLRSSKGKASVKVTPVKPPPTPPPRRRLHQVFSSEYLPGHEKTKVRYSYNLFHLASFH